MIVLKKKKSAKNYLSFAQQKIYSRCWRENSEFDGEQKRCYIFFFHPMKKEKKVIDGLHPAEVT